MTDFQPGQRVEWRSQAGQTWTVTDAAAEAETPNRVPDAAVQIAAEAMPYGFTYPAAASVVVNALHRRGWLCDPNEGETGRAYVTALENVAIAARILVDACGGNEDVRGVSDEEDAVRATLDALPAPEEEACRREVLRGDLDSAAETTSGATS